MGPAEAEPSLPSFPASADETLVEGAGARPMPEPALGRGDQVGRYLLLDPLGRGAMGQVFRAYDPDLDRQVAIKLLHEPVGGPDARDRLLREAKAMARIHHPHVIAVHDAGMHDDAVFIAMEIVDGPSLDRWLATPRRPAEILDVLTGAARGLAAAHAAGVIHRDFKPANVLVTADGRAKVGDFGLAGIEDPVTNPGAALKATHAMGTPAYMSPEHFAGVGIDARSDQFSFAIALHEALYGTRPFAATTWPELVAQVTSGSISPALTARRGKLDGVLRRALAHDPAQRFPSMDALIAALERARRPRWRTWAPVAGVAAALGLALTARLGASEADPSGCDPGAARVAAFWGPEAKAALRVEGRDFTKAYVRGARRRFEQQVDDYAARWAAGHDESCAIVGPRAQGGTPAQRHAAQCFESRLDSLRGLVELATTEPLQADRVTDLVRVLPELEACTSGSWVPYPADPEQAARAAALHRRLERIELDHVQGRHTEALAGAEAAVEAARALGDRYLLARALMRQGVVLEEDPQASPRFEEALALAFAGGFERLAVRIIEAVLRSSTSTERTKSWRELLYLAAVARGIVERTSGDHSWLGNLAIDECNLLRRARQLDEAAACERRTEEHFVRAGDQEGVAKARINQAITLMRQGRIDEAVPRLEAAIADLSRTVDATSELYFQAQHVLVGVLHGAGRMHDAFPVAAAAYARARELYAPDAQTYRTLLLAYLTTTGNVGELELARQGLEQSREITAFTPEERDAIELLELELGLAEGRYEHVLTRVAELRERSTSKDPLMHAWFDLYTALPLFALGRRTEVHALLLDPPISALPSRKHEGLAATVVMLAVLSGAPSPSEGSWRDHVPPPPYELILTRHMIEIIDAVESGRDTVATVRRVRDELAAMYHPGEITVRVLDAWLADPELPAR